MLEHGENWVRKAVEASLASTLMASVPPLGGNGGTDLKAVISQFFSLENCGYEGNRVRVRMPLDMVWCQTLIACAKQC